MRLIDADELLIRYSDSEDVPTTTPEEHNVYVAAVEDFFNHVESSPTIEAEPVRHGKWIRIRDEEGGNVLYECSECRKGDVHVPTVKVPYCWNCGAKMDGGEDETD